MTLALQSGADPALERLQLGVALVLAGLALAPLGVATIRRLFDGRNVFFARWGFMNALWVALVLVGTSASVNSVAQDVLGERWDGMTQRLAGVLSFLPASALIAWYALSKDPKGLACLGFWPGRKLQSVAVGLLGYVGWVPILLGTALLWPWVVDALGGEYRPQEVATSLLALDGERFWIAVVAAVALQPFFEELVFRAFLQPLLVQNLGDRGGVFLTSALFAAAHGWNAFLPIFGFSLLLGMLMLRTQRLVGVWAVHALHNALVIYLLTSVPAARDFLGFGTMGLP
ncbi:MAG: CPBP family intramembrane metalloprotease [Planctomycetes bacterium]|nr:CPBP family intramembrane metalloprotease [Planctomycetota bacterium]